MTSLRRRLSAGLEAFGDVEDELAGVYQRCEVVRDARHDL